MKSQRYLSLLTGVALASSTIVIPHAHAQSSDRGSVTSEIDPSAVPDTDDTDEPGTGLGFDIGGDIIPGCPVSWRAEGLTPTDTFGIAVTDAAGNAKPADGWTARHIEVEGVGELEVTAPGTAREGDVAVITASRDGNPVGQARLTVAADGEIPLQFDRGGDIQAGVPYAIDELTLSEEADVNWTVVDADGEPKSNLGWQVLLYTDRITVTAPNTARAGDRIILTAVDGGQLAGKANLSVVADGPETLAFDLAGGVLPGQEMSWPVEVADDVELDYSVVDAAGEPSFHEWEVRVEDGELHVTPSPYAREGDVITITASDNGTPVGRAVFTTEIDGLLFDISGDVLAGSPSTWPVQVDNAELDWSIVDADGNEKSADDWDVRLIDGELTVTPAIDALENDRIILTARDGERTVGRANLRVAADGQQLRFRLTEDVLPGVESSWPFDAADDAGLAITVVDAEGNAKPSAGWVTRVEGGRFFATPPSDAAAGDVARVVFTEGEQTVGLARLRVAVDGDASGSSASPWWLVLVPILGVAGVIALLTGGSTGSSGSSGIVEDEAATDEQAAPAPAPAPVAPAPAPAPAPGQATTPINDGQGGPGTAQNQAHNQAQNQQTAAEQAQLANTGVSGVMYVLLAGLIAATIGAVLLLVRRRSS